MISGRCMRLRASARGAGRDMSRSVARRCYLLVRTADESERRYELKPGAGAITIGRGEGTRIDLDWDEEVSRLHGVLEPLGEEWVYSDDGLSRNGSFVNGERVAGRRRLRDNDELLIGRTKLSFRAIEGAQGRTAPSSGIAKVKLSDAQRRVLVALCRPVLKSGAYSLPASNQEIADELFISVNTVKTHMRKLAGAFAVAELPKNQQRARVVELAFQSGTIDERELRHPGDPAQQA
jgi:DNA-binding CsgD family transcriptional regulator